MTPPSTRLYSAAAQAERDGYRLGARWLGIYGDFAQADERRADERRAVARSTTTSAAKGREEAP